MSYIGIERKIDDETKTIKLEYDRASIVESESNAIIEQTLNEMVNEVFTLEGKTGKKLVRKGK